MSDTKEYYTHVSTRNGKIYYRGYEVKNGVRNRVHAKLNFQPTLFLESTEPTDYKTIFGDDGPSLKVKKFESIAGAREFVKKYDDVFAIYGYAPSRWQYEFIARNFPEVIQVTLDEVVAVGFDIETKVGVNGPAGVPDPHDALEEITHIALENHNTGDMVCYTTAKTSLKFDEGANYTIFDTEEELLEAIIRYVEEVDPDIMYGFYSDFFDVPYIINRIRNVLGEDAANRLSPFGIIDEREYEINDETHIEYTVVGRTMFDTQAMYKKFVLTKQEAYSLDHLSKVELGVGKLENPCSTFKEFCESPEHVDTFARYNVIDTKRLTQLDKKKGLLSLAVSLAYLMKCNFDDVFSPVRYWECYIQSILLAENRFVAVKRQRHERTTIPGAYVEEPVPGFYKWVVSIDATALYPSIMKALNLSPETLVRMVPNVTVESMLQGKTLEDFGVSRDHTLAANGVMFHRKFTGIIPRLVDNVLDGRRSAKNEMLRLKQVYVDTKDEDAKKKSDFYSVLEKALKVAANSLYGICLQEGFMFYDPRLGEAITLTGQYIIVKVGDHCDRRFNEYFKTEGVRYTIYRDTDSCFFTLGNIVEKYWGDKGDIPIVNALDKLIETKLRPFIDEATDEIAHVQNHHVKTIFFKRENICSGGFWMAKKKYALKVYDSEGVRIPEGDYKIMGIEVVRSSTPQLVRDRLKKCVELVIDGKVVETREFADKVRKEFNTVPISTIAFPRSANNLAKYRDPQNIYRKATPIAVRASLLYNHLLDLHAIGDRYNAIGEGDKMKFIYLREPNTLREDVIGFVDELPSELNLERYVDRKMQYEKTFLAPLDNIFKAVGWKLEEESTLDEFF